MTLSAEQRRKVAAACGLNYGGGWSESNLFTLVRKVAQVIEGVDQANAKTCTACRFAQLVAENDVNGLEALLLELLGDNDG